MPQATPKKIVPWIVGDVDRNDVLATTYQMRNFYRQLKDGFFTGLDVMNYIQHHQIVKWCKPGNRVLDVCCGRGLLLPLLRYRAADIGSYTGVDIEPKNAKFLTHRANDEKPLDEAPGKYYPFPVQFVWSNVAEMASKLTGLFDVIVYTSSIEHMHKEVGQQTLHECRKVAKPGAIMILTCPNTPEDQDGFDTQYRAHVYEWKRSELLDGLQAAQWQVITEYGLWHDRDVLHAELERVGMGKLFERISMFVPAEWAVPVFSPMFPKSAKEIGFICKAI